VTVTVVPTGTLAPAMATATGLVVPAGRVMSGAVNDPPGAAGAVTPATEVIRRVGAFGSVAEVGDATDGWTPVKFAVSVFVKASARIRPTPPSPPHPPPAPPCASIVPPLPDIVVATSRT